MMMLSFFLFLAESLYVILATEQGGDDDTLVTFKREFGGMRYDVLAMRVKKYANETSKVLLKYDPPLYAVISNKMLRKFSVNPLENEGRLDHVDRMAINVIAQFVSQQTAKKIDFIALYMCIGKICKNYGINGFYFSFNILLTSSAMPTSSNVDQAHVRKLFSMFYDKYIHWKHTSVKDHKVREGALVYIKQLKNQNDSELHDRAQHLSKSYGHIISNVSIRHNSRNQIEYPVQSLSNPKVKLRVRPKYLQQIKEIHIHIIAADCHLYKYQDFIVELLKDKTNRVLFLPHRMSEDCVDIMHPMDNGGLWAFQTRNKGKLDLIADIGVMSFSVFFMCFRSEASLPAKIVLAPYYIKKDIWERVLDSMKKKSNPSDKQKEKALIKANKELFNRNYEKLMKLSFKKTLDFDELKREFTIEQDRVIGKSLKKNAKFYEKLVDEIKIEMIHLIHEQHSDYFQAYTMNMHNGTIGNTLKELYRISVIQNYLKANAKGQDLHVICFGKDEEHAIVKFDDLTQELAMKLNEDWKIRNLTTSQLLAAEIIFADLLS